MRLDDYEKVNGYQRAYDRELALWEEARERAERRTQLRYRADRAILSGVAVAGIGSLTVLLGGQPLVVWTGGVVLIVGVVVLLLGLAGSALASETGAHAE